MQTKANQDSLNSENCSLESKLRQHWYKLTELKKKKGWEERKRKKEMTLTS